MKYLFLAFIFSCSNLSLKKVDQSGNLIQGNKRLDTRSTAQKKIAVFKEPIIEKKTEKKIQSRKITLYFKTDSSELTDFNINKLRSFIKESLEKGNIKKVEISGYTDSTGQNGHNQKLSEKRASVAKAIISDYLDQNIIQMRGKGSQEADPTDYEKDRKVDILLIF